MPRIGNDVVYSLLILNKVKLSSILASGENMAYWKVRQLKGCPSSTKCRNWGSDPENHRKSISRESNWTESDLKHLSSLKLLYHIPCNANYCMCWLFLNWAKAMWEEVEAGKNNCNFKPKIGIPDPKLLTGNLPCLVLRKVRNHLK